MRENRRKDNQAADKLGQKHIDFQYTQIVMFFARSPSWHCNSTCSDNVQALLVKYKNKVTCSLCTKFAPSLDGDFNTRYKSSNSIHLRPTSKIDRFGEGHEHTVQLRQILYLRYHDLPTYSVQAYKNHLKLQSKQARDPIRPCIRQP